MKETEKSSKPKADEFDIGQIPQEDNSVSGIQPIQNSLLMHKQLHDHDLPKHLPNYGCIEECRHGKSEK